jgi:hypothetical protein
MRVSESTGCPSRGINKQNPSHRFNQFIEKTEREEQESFFSKRNTGGNLPTILEMNRFHPDNMPVDHAEEIGAVSVAVRMEEGECENLVREYSRELSRLVDLAQVNQVNIVFPSGPLSGLNCRLWIKEQRVHCRLTTESAVLRQRLQNVKSHLGGYFLKLGFVLGSMEILSRDRP